MPRDDTRTLYMGGLLSRTLHEYLDHFGLYLGIAAVSEAFVTGISLLLQAADSWHLIHIPLPTLGRMTGELLGAVATFAQSWIGVFVGFFPYLYALGATAFAMSSLSRGRATTVREAYSNVSRQAWPLAKLGLLLAASIAACYLLILVPVFFAGLLAGAFLPGILSGLGYGFLELVYILGVLLCIAVLIRFVVAVPTLLLERLDPWDAVKRSLTLTQGHRFRIFVITSSLLGGIVAVSWILAAPIQTVGFFAGADWSSEGLKLDVLHPPFWSIVLAAAASGAGRALCGPPLLIALVHIYFDLRGGQEGPSLMMAHGTGE